MPSLRTTGTALKLLLSLLAIVALAPIAGAATRTKANNVTPLNQGASWFSGTAPGSGDIALWDSTVTGANSVSLGASLSWLGIQITNPGGAISISGGGNTLTLGASGIDASTTTQQLTLNTNVTLGAVQTWTFNGSTFSALSAGMTLNNGGNTLTITNGNFQLNGIVTGAGGLTRSGSSQLTINNAMTYTGTTTIGSGALFLLGNNNTMGSLSTSSAIVNNGSFAFNRTDTLTQGTDFNNVISGSGGIDKRSTGTTILSNANTFTGATIIRNGALEVSSLNSVSGGVSASSLGAPTTVANGTIALGAGTTMGQLTYTGSGETTDRVINLNGTTGGATIDQSGTGLLKFTSDLTTTGAGSKTLTLQGSTAGTGEIAGAIINNSVTNITSLTKAGTGTWTLSGTNTYTGPTVVNAGTLLLGAGGSLASAVTVNAGTFGGSGSASGNVTIGNGSGGHDAFIAPGSSAGTFTTTGSLTLLSDATYAFELNGTTGFADKLVANGVSIDSSALFSFTLLGDTSGLAVNNTFSIIDNTAVGNISGSFSNLIAGSSFDAGGGLIFSVSGGGGVYGNELVLTVTAIPEPSPGVALAALGLSVALYRTLRRRSRQNGIRACSGSL